MMEGNRDNKSGPQGEGVKEDKASGEVMKPVKQTRLAQTMGVGDKAKGR